MQPAANGWNLQRRRTRLSLSAWSRIVPPTHLSCNNLDRRSDQTKPMKQHHVNQKQFSAVNNKQSELNKAGIQNTSQDFAPCTLSWNPLFENCYLSFCQFCLGLLEFAIFSFLHFVWNLNRHQVKRSTREMDCWGLERSGGKLQKITQTLFLLIRLASVELLYL